MVVVFWIAFTLTVAEFIASPINTLKGSAMHLQRLHDVGFPLTFAKVLSVIELFAVAAVIVGIWVPIARRIGGIVLAACFLPYVAWAVGAHRPIGDVLGLLFFIACAVMTTIY